MIDFYKKQRTDLADFFLAAWRFQHRAKLGRPSSTLDEAAAESGISRKYLQTIWSVLTEPTDEVGPIAAIQSMWRELPVPLDGKTDSARPGCETMRDFVVELRRRLKPDVKNLQAEGMQAGAQPFVLWKDRQYVANRMRYCGTGGLVRPESPQEGYGDGSEACGSRKTRRYQQI